ncbi:LysR family transcriptional regulator [Streptomyces sp. Z26]|uniref:LysR family transcriptional regulator n=1 Tax=Streptomyces sp. Z26 TaxID=2500177 RepID=UPI000EF15595|nr:LysR family transcriptional regulator [Streptomyces sp. Z26]RLL67873.1 LysR family transcriptional regulator [Streptomyces sp. Z26]
MELDLLRTFLAVHRAGSFTRAGALLGLSQPAVTGQMRTLERRLGRPLFDRGARGVTPTAAADELARKVAPHLDALLEFSEAGVAGEPEERTVHLAGPPEFTSLRVLPALAPLVAEGLTVRTVFGTTEENLDGLATGHCDLALSTARPRGELLATTALWDEELVLVGTPYWAGHLGGATGTVGVVAAVGATEAAERAPASVLLPALADVPVVAVHESLPLLSRYWATVFDADSPVTRSAAVVVPDLRAVLDTVLADAGIAVLPRYLCAAALHDGRLVALLEPQMPPLRTYFLSVRAGTLALPHLARAHERLLRAATSW